MNLVRVSGGGSTAKLAGTFIAKLHQSVTVNVGASINKLRIVGWLNNVSTEWWWSSQEPNTCYRKVGTGDIRTLTIPTSSENFINAVNSTTFTMGGIAEPIADYTFTYYVDYSGVSSINTGIALSSLDGLTTFTATISGTYRLFLTTNTSSSTNATITVKKNGTTIETLSNPKTSATGLVRLFDVITVALSTNDIITVQSTYSNTSYGMYYAVVS